MLTLELVILLAGIAALLFSAITLSSLNKIKSKCPTVDPKEYSTAKGLQVAQIVVSVIVIILSAYITYTGKSPLSTLRKYIKRA